LLNGILNQANFFISKSDSFGNFIWAKKISLSTGNSDVSSISSDNAGNVYVSGYFMDSVDFDPGPNIFMLKTNYSCCPFIFKLDNNGNFLWAKAFVNNVPLSSGSGNATAIKVDINNNVYITGYLSGTLDFDPGSLVYPLTAPTVTFNSQPYHHSYNNTFIIKLNSLGDFQWAKSTNCNSDNSPSSIEIDSSNNIYLTGSFSGTTDFDLGSGTSYLTSQQWLIFLFLN
jgi:hypothetical protein